jgi:NADPH:quinone reductase-like Zn-dependent oxidoreductase
VVDSVFAFDDAVAALNHVSTGRARGKVVLEMS